MHCCSIDVYACVGLCTPLILEIEVYRLGLCLLLTSTIVLMSDLLLDPSLEPDVELPSSLLELKSGQILLVSALLVIKGKEQTF